MKIAIIKINIVQFEPGNFTESGCDIDGYRHQYTVTMAMVIAPNKLT